MRLAIRLLVPLLILSVMVFSLLQALPWLSTQLLISQLERQGYQVQTLKIDRIGTQSAWLSEISLSDSSIGIEANNLLIRYTLEALFKGRLDAIELEQLDITARAGSESETSTQLPDLAPLLAVMATPLYQQLPVDFMRLGRLQFFAVDGQRQFSASGSIQNQLQGLEGDFDLWDQQDVRYKLTLNTVPQSGLQLTLAPEKTDDEPLLSVYLDVLQAEQALQGKIDLKLAGLSKLIPMQQAASGEIEARFSYAADADRDKVAIFSVKLQSGEIQADGWELGQLSARLQGTIEIQQSQLVLSFSQDSELNVQALAQAESRLDSLQISLPDSISFDSARPMLQMSDGAAIRIRGLDLDTLKMAELDFQQLQIQYDGQADVAERCSMSALLEATSMQLEAGEVELMPMQLQALCPEHAEAPWRIEMQTGQIVVQDPDISMSLQQCRGSLGNSERGLLLDPDPAELSGQLQCLSGPLNSVFDARLRMHSLNQVGRAEFDLQGIQPDDMQPLMAAVFRDWQQPFEIVSGEMLLRGVYRWWKSSGGRPREAMQLNVELNDAGGHYQEILFSGLNYKDSIKVLPRLDTLDFSALTVEAIDIGLALTNFSVMLQMTDTPAGPLPLLRLKDARVSLLKGQITADPVLLNMNYETQAMVLNAEGLDLAEIVDLQQLDGLDVSGRLDGHIPLTIGAEGASIVAGKVSAEVPGGYIRYQPLSSDINIGSASSESELLMRVLEDLEYNKLDIDVNYEQDGQLDMLLSIKGMSPNVDAKRPVHFNLSLQQNLLTLLRGLRYVDGINENIDRSVQNYFQLQGN